MIVVTYSSELSHHGILGQKWGKKNGPPYPLDPSDHSASEKKAGWTKSLDKKPSEKNQNGGFNKKYIAVGVGVAASALAIYGGYKLKNSGFLDDKILLGKQFLSRKLGKAAGASDDIFKNGLLETVENSEKASAFLKNEFLEGAAKNGFKLHDREITLSEACKLANPNYSSDIKARNNCGPSVIAQLMNQLGVSCEARLATNEEITKGGILTKDILKPFPNAYFDDLAVSRDSLSDLDSFTSGLSDKIIKKTGNDGFCIIRLKSANGNAGHYVTATVTNGKCHISDPQSGKDNIIPNLMKSIQSENISRGLEIAKIDIAKKDDIQWDALQNFIISR